MFEKKFGYYVFKNSSLHYEMALGPTYSVMQ